MPNARFLMFALLPLFAGCQLFSVYQAEPKARPQQRLQGELHQEQGQLILRPCGEQRRLAVIDDGDITREAGALLADGNEQLFVDLLGALESSDKEGLDGEMHPSLVYRLQGEGSGCNEPGFDRLLLRAGGQEPEWTLGVGEPGLVLLRPSQEPLALPYLEERLPQGGLNISSEANGQRLELWLAPQRCVDSMSGAVQHLSAELRLNGEVHRGCASFGGARSR